jgi:hypothetical protein
MKIKLIAAAVAAMLSASASAQWAESNMGFESGNTSGWSIGANNTGTMTNTITGGGTGVSLITGTPGTVTFNAGSHPGAGTAGSAYYQPPVSPTTWQFSAYGNNMLALQPNAQTNWNTVGAELGLTSTQISNLSSMLQQQAQTSGFGSGSITNLAYVHRTVTLTAGTTYNMSWNYIGTDYVPFNDGSITTLVPVSGTTGTTTVNNYAQNYALLGFTNPGTGDYSAGTFGSTGWQVSTYNVDTSGTYQLGFAVFNLDDTALSPVLLVDEQQGTTTQNGTTFGAVAPNPGTNAPSSPGSTPSTPPTPSVPTLVSSTAGTPIVSSSSSSGPTTTDVAMAAGITVTVLTITDTRTGATKVLGINRNTTAVSTTPVTTTVTSTTPVTTTTTTTPTTVNTYSDNSTQTVNGNPVTTQNTVNQVVVATNTVDDVQTASQNNAYSTRIDQYEYLSKANQRINMSLDSDVLSRHNGKGETLSANTALAGDEDKGWTYLIAEGQRSNTSDTYSMNTSRFGIGHEKKVKGNWIVGAQFNQVNGRMSGDQAGGTLTKNHVGLYSLYNHNDWLLKSDLGFAKNDYTNTHTLNELGLSNSGKATGTDVWLSNRLYTPAVNGFRPFAGVRVENFKRGAVTEAGSPLTAMTYDAVNKTNTIGEAGLRYDVKVKDAVNLSAEVGQTTSDITTARLGATFSPKENIVGNINIAQQRQQGVVNNMVQAMVRWFF